MINHNLLLYFLFDRTMTQEFVGREWAINYTEGDLFELAKKLAESEIKFPIIWLLDGYDVERDHMKRTSKLEGCRILFINVGDANDRYKKRFETNYQQFLYKILMHFDEKIDKTNGISRELKDRIRTYPLKDMLEETSQTGKQAVLNGIWDAVMLTTDIEIKNDCFPEFKIKI